MLVINIIIMDKFYKSLVLVKEDIDKIKESYIIDSQVKHKQLLVYYIYRIICKFEKLITVNSSGVKPDKIFEMLGIPSDMNKKCYPLSGKIPNKLDKLDAILKEEMNLLEGFFDNYTTLPDRGSDEDINKMDDFIKSKSEKKQIQEDLILLSILLPKLSRVVHKPTLQA